MRKRERAPQDAWSHPVFVGHAVVCARQFQPHCGHFHESVGTRFPMGLPQRGQIRIQIFFVTVISHLLTVRCSILALSWQTAGGGAMEQRARSSDGSPVLIRLWMES